MGRVAWASKETQRLIDQKKLYVSPKQHSRLSVVGLFTTLVVDVIPLVCLISAPALLLQHGYCAVGSPEMFKYAEICEGDAYNRVPSWLLGIMILESIFQIVMKIKLAYLDSIDRIEASLKAGGILTRSERQKLFDGVMAAQSKDIAAYVENWFFGDKIEELSIHEIRDFIATKYFDGRGQEHLTEGETEQLDSFVQDLLSRIHKQKFPDKANKKEDPQTLLRPSVSRLARGSKDFMQNPADWEAIEVQRRLLQQLVPQAHNVPEAQLAKVLRTITVTRRKIFGLDAPPTTETAATDEKNVDRVFAFPISDPVHGVRVPPLLFQLALFLFMEIVLRTIMWLAGFRRYCVVDTPYYFHPGTTKKNQEVHSKKRLPLVFMHGVGVGPIVYIPLIIEMLKTGRPIFVPENHSVSAFRPWISPSSIPSPHHVAAALSTMLSTHGFAKATFAGHSFGSFWLSYVAKYAPGFVGAMIFLDPVCFCLYHSYLAQRMVYNAVHIGDYEFLVLTDMMTNYSMQRIGWARSNLFAEDVGDKPCVVFVSEKDSKAPSIIQKPYLQEHGAKVTSIDDAGKKDYETKDISIVVFNEDHGDWLKDPFTSSPKVVECMQVLSERAEKKDEMTESERSKMVRYSERFSLFVPGARRSSVFSDPKLFPLHESVLHE